MLTRGELERSPLFQGVSYEDYRRMLGCFQAVHKSFEADRQVLDFGDAGAETVGVVERGSVALIRIDEEGIATVLEELGPGGMFGRYLAFAAAMGDSLETVSRTPCDVLFFDCSHLFRWCANACPAHGRLTQNMLGLLSEKAQSLSRRVDVLSRRSIRDKLLCYFRQCAEQGGGRTFTLPFSLSVLADYIATDRSAMMRELKRLREEGVVRTEGRRFTLAEGC